MPCALPIRSEEHTSELQSHDNLVCRLLLEKKNSSRRSRSNTFAPAKRRLCERSVLPVPACSYSSCRSLRGRAAAVAARACEIFFLNKTATTGIYPLSLPDPLPI